jgi:hypothetical protein
MKISEFISKHPLKTLFLGYVLAGLLSMVLMLVQFPFVWSVECKAEIDCASAHFVNRYELVTHDDGQVARILNFGGLNGFGGIEVQDTVYKVVLKNVEWINFLIYSMLLACGFFVFFKRYPVSPVKTVLFLVPTIVFWTGGWWVLVEESATNGQLRVPTEIALTKAAAAKAILNTAKTPLPR